MPISVKLRWQNQGQPVSSRSVAQRSHLRDGLLEGHGVWFRHSGSHLDAV